MAKHALNLFLKLALFTAVLLILGKTVPYDMLINNVIVRHVSYEDADRFGKWLTGEPAPEPIDTLRFCITLLLNTLLALPLTSAIITVFNGVKNNLKPGLLVKEWICSTLRRLIKLVAFTFMFWALLRFLPYQTVFPDRETYSAFTLAAVVAFNVLLTAVCYRFIMKIITIKRSL